MRNSRPCQDIRQALVEPAELAEDVRTAEAQIAAEHGIAHKAAQRIALARLRTRRLCARATDRRLGREQLNLGETEKR